MSEAYIVAMGRSAVAKGVKRGSLLNQSPTTIASKVLNGTLKKIPQLDLKDIDDLIVGCAFPEAEQGMNIGRNIALESDLPIGVSGQVVNRFCASGLQSIATAANVIMSKQMDVVVAGGIEFMSAVPINGERLAPSPGLMKKNIDSYIQMGITAENVASKYGVTRLEQDEFAVNSHEKFYKAQQKGYFVDEIIPLDIDGKVFKQDEGVRADSTVEALSKLRPVFKKDGTITAGNASQISDGTAFLVLMSKEKVEQLGVKPIARFVSFAVKGLDPAYMGLGPTKAIPKVLELTNLTLDDIDLIELNEAFASQSIQCIKELNLPKDKVNVNGGAIAHGHPLGATGSLLTIKLLSEMKRRGDCRYGLVSMCIGGGMGAAGIFEIIN